jgi:DNA-binding NtrC family response regulator
MNKISILLADDDQIFLKLTSRLLEEAGYRIEAVSGMVEAERALANGNHDIMMLDMCFPALHDGFGMLEKVHEYYPGLPVLMISGSGHIPDAVLAIKNGALDFIEKPLDSAHLLLKLQRISDSILLNSELQELKIAAIGMKGNSKAMQSLYDEIVRAAKFDCPVLITGETGVGKELAANAIHRLSNKGTKNLISLNCASIPKDLFEAELFGYESGAFTGAAKPHKGYFEYADGNNIFLDEISQLPLEVQAKLLRVVSESEIQKLGGKIMKIRTRIISATNQDLDDLTGKTLFRKDLLYRLNTIQIRIPALRNRVEDIPLLADYFMDEFCRRNEIPPKQISPTAKAWLCEQAWPGNVRELKNTVERAVVFATNDHLSVVDFTTNGEADPLGQGSLPLRKALISFEKAYIENILRAYSYNVRQCAFHLDIDKSNLFKKIANLGIVLPKK